MCLPGHELVGRLFISRATELFIQLLSTSN